MDVGQLRAFLAVAQELHFGRAAERLHMTQPPLSRIIKQLETELGTRLLDRNTRSVKLTSSGQALVAPATEVLRGPSPSRRGRPVRRQRRGRTGANCFCWRVYSPAGGPTRQAGEVQQAKDPAGAVQPEFRPACNEETSARGDGHRAGTMGRHPGRGVLPCGACGTRSWWQCPTLTRLPAHVG